MVENFTIERLVDHEVEDCYKRVICAASTGELDNPRVQNVLAIFNTDLVQDTNISNKAMKFIEAARYGGSLRNVAKCEQRYTCTVGMDILQELFRILFSTKNSRQRPHGPSPKNG